MPSIERDAVRDALLAQLDAVLASMYPAGVAKRNRFYVGNVAGDVGDSLDVMLDGNKKGCWLDRATGEGGDILALLAAYHGLDTTTQFPALLQLAQNMVGADYAPTTAILPRQPKPQEPDTLGIPSAKWQYTDAAGRLLAVVYRYDTPTGKEFRPWDVKRHKVSPPDPRPLYNQVGIINAPKIILVEGEKCAQALIDIGIAATTAMQGAKAPVGKTDWTPLAGKNVVILSLIHI